MAKYTKDHWLSVQALEAGGWECGFRVLGYGITRVVLDYNREKKQYVVFSRDTNMAPRYLGYTCTTIRSFKSVKQARKYYKEEVMRLKCHYCSHFKRMFEATVQNK